MNVVDSGVALLVFPDVGRLHFDGMMPAHGLARETGSVTPSFLSDVVNDRFDQVLQLAL